MGKLHSIYRRFFQRRFPSKTKALVLVVAFAAFTLLPAADLVPVEKGPLASAEAHAATPAEVDLLARLITAEAAGEPYVGQVAVGAVVLNRVRSGLFPATIAGVIYQPYQFETVLNGRIDQPPTPTAVRAALDALSGWDPTGGALYFYNYTQTWNSFLWSRPWRATIGLHRFVA